MERRDCQLLGQSGEGEGTWVPPMCCRCRVQNGLYQDVERFSGPFRHVNLLHCSSAAQCRVSGSSLQCMRWCVMGQVCLSEKVFCEVLSDILIFCDSLSAYLRKKEQKKTQTHTDRGEVSVQSTVVDHDNVPALLRTIRCQRIRLHQSQTLMVVVKQPHRVNLNEASRACQQRTSFGRES